MISLVTLKNAILKTFQGAPGPSISVDFETKGGNSDNAELYHSPGLFSKPHDDVSGIAIDAEGQNFIIATHNYKLNKDIDKGNTLLYSIDADGVVKSSVLLNQNGEFVFNDGSRSAVAFDKLKEGFDQLKADHNDLVTKFLAHIHVTTATVGATAVPGVIAPTVLTDDPSSASIDDSEVVELLLP